LETGHVLTEVVCSPTRSIRERRFSYVLRGVGQRLRVIGWEHTGSGCAPLAITTIPVMAQNAETKAWQVQTNRVQPPTFPQPRSR